MSSVPAPRLFYGWIVVWATHLILFTIFGVTYSFSSFFASIQQEFHASRAGVSFTFSLAVFLYFAIGVPAGAIADRTHVRWVAGAGAMFLALGMWLASQAGSLRQLYLAYALAVGFGVGCAYVPSIAAVQPWFIKRRGLAAGIASAGIGLGTLIGPIVAVRLIDAYGWRATLQVFALVALVLGVAAASMMEKSPAARGLHPDNDPLGGSGNLARSGMDLRAAVRTREFRLFFLSILATAAVQFMPFAHLARHAVDRGLTPAQGALLIGLIGVGSFCGRFFLTGYADRIGLRNMLVAMYIGMGLACLWWLLTLSLPASFVALGVFALLFGTCYGGFVGIAPPLTMEYFGGRNLSGLIGALYLAAGIGSLFAPVFAGWMYDVSGTYAVPIIVGAVANGIAALIATRLPRQGTPQAAPAA
jgi:MFS family permease